VEIAGVDGISAVYTVQFETVETCNEWMNAIQRNIAAQNALSVRPISFCGWEGNRRSGVAPLQASLIPFVDRVGFSAFTLDTVAGPGGSEGGLSPENFVGRYVQICSF